jgi:hypothetical protein
MLVNALGATATGATVLVVIAAKFSEGAWITVVTIPAILVLMYGVRRHYKRIQHDLATDSPLELTNLSPPLVVMPVQQWSKLAKRALCAALSVSNDVKALHVVEEDKPDPMCDEWTRYVIEPARRAGLPEPELVVLKSPYRFVIGPIVDYAISLAEENTGRRVVVVVPEMVEQRWYNYFLHSQRAAVLKATLLLKGNDRVSVLNVPWYLE